MAIQTATTGSLEDVQAILIAKMRYVGEHNAPCANLIEKFTLAQGDKQITVPKTGQMTADDLVDGQDITSSKDISISTTDLTCNEVGLKVIVTDKLLRQSQPSIFSMVGRQMGDAMARKRDTDIIALFSALNAGTTLGADDQDLTLNMAAACVARSVGNYGGEPLPKPIVAVHHPNAIYYLTKSAAAIGATYYAGILGDLSEELLRNFWKIQVSGVNFFEDGNITKITDYDSAYGAIFSKSAMCIIESQAPRVERERDASLRAWEIVIVSDYGVFELDDAYGFPMQYEIGNPGTST